MIQYYNWSEMFAMTGNDYFSSILRNIYVPISVTRMSNWQNTVTKYESYFKFNHVFCDMLYSYYWLPTSIGILQGMKSSNNVMVRDNKLKVIYRNIYTGTFVQQSN